ncbi:fasciclin domain-containing protein [Mucilaginibacter boryungensis]|uniref:Fasciclin domain-containing protein n=1 Tax=Mucilaginibacter boryungensis TaxID=768480 RepID=A0ABR9XKK7_9SPHI|nr:fasciclin domain-containing protein [Mucilaginibacter boryungensis]MBE9667732.1 fasciclin domain-containing protein [Mucilaginibacter boryungensis]
MKKSFLVIAASLLVCFTASQAMAQTDTAKKTTTTTTITTTTTNNAAADVVGALNSNPDYTTAALAVKTADLESVLKTGGPYTIFAPNNNAFTKLPAGKLDSLMKDPVKLSALLKGHIVNGKYAKADIIKALTAGKGKATLTTLDGQTLTLSISKTSTLQLTNAAGSTAEVTLYDLIGGNGVVNGLNGVLLPSK